MAAVNGGIVGGGYGGGGGTGLTPEQLAKLDGIQDGAQVNPKDVVPALRALDGNNNLAGVIQFIDSSNNEVQTGSSNQIAAIAIPSALCDNTQDPETDTGTATDHHSFLTDKAVNGGSLIVTIARLLYVNNAITGVSTTDVMVIQCERVIANQDGSYALQQLKHLKAIDLTGISTGTGWQLAAGETNPIGADALIGVWKQNQIDNYTEWIKRAELAGHETDFYLSYNNAFVANTYRSGDWVLSTDTTGPPTTANQIGQPDIASGSGVVAFAARTRSDADPNNLQWNTASVASDYSDGDVVYASLARDKGSHLKITLTSGGTLVGTGDAAYIWATADWVEVGNIANVAVAGDYFTLSDFEPSELRVRLPVQDVLGAVNTDGTNVSDALVAAVQGDNETVTLPDTFRVDLTNQPRYISITNTNQQKNIRIRIPNTDTQNDTDLKRLLKKRVWVYIGDWRIDVRTNASRSTPGTGITYSFDFAELSGTQPTGSTPVKVKIVGADVHRGEIPEAALEFETPNIVGNGANNGQAWKYKGNVAKWYDDLEWTIGKDLPASPVNSQRHTFTEEGTHKLPIDSKEKTGQAGFGFFSNVATSIIYSNSGAGVSGTRSFVMGYNSGDDVSEYTGMVAGDELWVIDTTNGTTTKLILTGAPGTATYGSGGNNRPGVYWATANLQSPPASNWMTAGRAYNVVVVKPTKVYPFDSFDYLNGKWTKVMDGRYQRDTIGTTFPDNPVKGQRLIVKADASTHLTASLGKFTKRGEATAGQFAAGDIAWVNLQGYNGIHIGFETTDDYQALLDLTSGDRSWYNRRHNKCNDPNTEPYRCFPDLYFQQ